MIDDMTIVIMTIDEMTDEIETMMIDDEMIDDVIIETMMIDEMIDENETFIPEMIEIIAIEKEAHLLERV
jgi:hypothetical protein